MDRGFYNSGKYLILNADDFGLSAGVNRGILMAHQAGVVSSASALVNMAWFLDAIFLAQEAPDLGVGLHFNLTEGKPVCDPSEIPSLVDDQGQCLPAEFESRWDKVDVCKELLAQWRRFTATGFRPTHLDSNHHVQRSPAVYQSMALLARQEHLPMRVTGAGWSGLLHPLSTDCLISDEYFQGDGRTRLLSYLYKMRPGVTELVCHPGFVDEHLKLASTWVEVGEIELQIVTDPLVIGAIQSLNIDLIHYGQLTRVRK